MWELVHKEGWAPKYWCFQIVVLEKAAESPLNCKEIKPVNPEGNQPLILIEKTDVDTEAPNTLSTWCEDSLEKILDSPLNCKEIKPVNPKGSQSWIFIGESDAEVPILGHLMWRTDSLEVTLMLGKIVGRRRGQQKMR